MKPSLACALFVALAVSTPVRADLEDPARLRGLAEAAAGNGASASLDPRVRLPRCAQAPAAALEGATVQLSCAEPAWTVFVPVRIAELRSVLVLQRPLARGELLTADAVAIEQRPALSVPHGAIDDPARATSRVLRRPLAAGALVGAADIESPRVVKRGQLVTLLGRSGAFEVRMSGKALMDGAESDRIQVENSSSRRVVEGIVRSADLVEVGL